MVSARAQRIFLSYLRPLPSTDESLGIAKTQGSAVTEEVQDTPLACIGTLQPLRKRARETCDDGTCYSGTFTPKLEVDKRQSAGFLSCFVNMPLDIFSLIAVHLHPLDMLHLSRTSKLLRPMMLSRRTRSAWIISLASVDGLPSCPSIMSEPFYAALLFDHYCFWCGVDGATWIDYAIRSRLCEEHYKALIQSGSEIFKLEPKEAVSLYLSLVPCETGSDYEKAKELILPENRMLDQKYHTANIQTLIEKHERLVQQDPESAQFWMAETLASVNAAHEHASMVLAWIRESELASIQATMDRMSAITNRLQELGYTEDDFPQDESAWWELMNQSVPLTDDMWCDILPELQEILALEKDRKTQEVDDRLDYIVPWYERYVEENFTDEERGLMPNLADARDLPSIVALARSNHAEGELPEAAFHDLIDEVLADVEVYKTRTKRELVDMVRCDLACLDLRDVPADDILERYCAYFECYCFSCQRDPDIDGCTYFTYEQLHRHWREANMDIPWLCADEYDRPGWDPMAGVPKFWPHSEHSAPLIGKWALEAVGIPLGTPRTVLDEWTMQGRLFCACGHPGLPPLEQMSWGKLLLHLLRQIHEHAVRLEKQREVRGAYNPNTVLRDSHPLNPGIMSCVKFLPKGANTAAASMRTTVSNSVRAQIEAKLSTETYLITFTTRRVVPVCRMCLEGLVTGEPSWSTAHKFLPVTHLPSRAEEIVWHMQSCHEKDFEEGDILLF